MKIETMFKRDKENNQLTTDLYNEIRNLILKSNIYNIFLKQVRDTATHQDLIGDVILYVWNNYDTERNVKLMTYTYIVLESKIKQALRDIKADIRAINYIDNLDIKNPENNFEIVDPNVDLDKNINNNLILNLIKERYSYIQWDNDYTNYLVGVMHGYKKRELMEDYNITENKYRTIIKEFRKGGVGLLNETLNFFNN